jgi:bifunctional non-homologous end joining protein LigD
LTPFRARPVSLGDVEAISNLPAQSCFIDDDTIVVDERGLSVFDLCYRCHDHAAVLCAFDLIELDGDDLRPLPIEYRKCRLGKLLQPAQRSQTGITLNKHYEGDGAVENKLEGWQAADRLFWEVVGG